MMKKYTEIEIEYLKDNFSHKETKLISKYLNRSIPSIRHKAKSLGLKKSTEFISNIKSKAGLIGGKNSVKLRIKKYGDVFTNEQRSKGGKKAAKNLKLYYEKNPEKAYQNRSKAGKIGGKMGGQVTKEQRLGKNYEQIFGKKKAEENRKLISMKSKEMWSKKTTSERNVVLKPLIEKGKLARFKKGEHHSSRTEFKKNMIPWNKGKPHLAGQHNPWYGKPPPKGTGRGKGGFRGDLGHYCRSTYEANYCRILKYNKIKYIYEHKTFKFLNEQTSYTPDIYIPSEKKFIEIKGWMSPISERKIKLFKKYHPFLKLIIVGPKEIARLKENYKSMLKWE